MGQQFSESIPAFSEIDPVLAPRLGARRSRSRSPVSQTLTSEWSNRGVLVCGSSDSLGCVSVFSLSSEPTESVLCNRTPVVEAPDEDESVPTLQPLQQQQQSVWSITPVFGTIVALSCSDGKTHLFDYDENEIVMSLNNNPGILWDSAYFAKSSLLACGSGNAVRLWKNRLDDDRILRASVMTTLGGHLRSIPSLVCREDISSNRLVTGSRDRTARIWDVTTSKKIGLLRANQTVSCVDMSEDRIVVGTQYETIRFWDPRSFRFDSALTVGECSVCHLLCTRERQKQLLVKTSSHVLLYDFRRLTQPAGKWESSGTGQVTEIDVDVFAVCCPSGCSIMEYNGKTVSFWDGFWRSIGHVPSFPCSPDQREAEQ